MYRNCTNKEEYMKKIDFKKLLLLVLAVVFAFSLAACNNEDEKSNDNALPTITLTENMTLNEVKAALKDVKNFKEELCYDNNYKETYYWCENGGAAYCNDEHGDQYMYVISEDNKFYLLEYQYQMSSDTCEYNEEIIDATGYDTANDAFLRSLQNELDYYLDRVMPEDEWKIENGKIVIDHEDGYVVKLYDFNCTTAEVPEHYANYKELKATKNEIAEYYCEDNYASLISINGYLRTFTVPETYNGKDVKSVCFFSSTVETYATDGWFKSSVTLEEITIPKTIVLLAGLENYTELKTINYLGTKDEWNNVMVVGDKMLNDIKSEYTVNCSDGTIVIGE